MGVAAALTGTITTKIQQIIRLMRVRGFSMFAFPAPPPTFLKIPSIVLCCLLSFNFLATWAAAIATMVHICGGRVERSDWTRGRGDLTDPAPVTTSPPVQHCQTTSTTTTSLSLTTPTQSAINISALSWAVTTSNHFCIQLPTTYSPIILSFSSVCFSQFKVVELELGALQIISAMIDSSTQCCKV